MRAALLALTLVACAATAQDLRGLHDFDFLVGDWQVHHRRLKTRLAGSTQWIEFDGTQSTRLALDGAGNVSDNWFDIPGNAYRGVSVRSFDAKTGLWAIWWLDGRDPTTLGTPVVGRFAGDSGTFAGNDMLRGRPVAAELRWSRIHSAHPHWEQAWSPDGGKSWEVNWAMDFTRTSPAVKPFARAERPAAPRDWDFLVGSWAVAHRRLKHRLVGNNDWETFTGTLVNWPLMGGMGNVGDNLMNFPAGAYHGIGLRAFDARTGQWLGWWLDGRDPLSLAPPMRGAFVGGIGTMTGTDNQGGKSILVRVIWSRITPTSARWEQASSADNGATWETNWISDFTRRA